MNDNVNDRNSLKNVCKTGKKTGLFFVIFSMMLCISACGADMPWLEPEITEDMPPHILDETEAVTQTDAANTEAEQENNFPEGSGWNKLDTVSIAENRAALANTGSIIERENYIMLSYIEVSSQKECFFVCPSAEIHLVYYDVNKQYIDGRASGAVEGEFLELPPDCSYLTVSMERSALEDSFLVQENEEERNVIFVEEGRTYSSVKKAVEQIADEGIIVIFPGIYRGNVKAWGKDIVFYGTDKDTCIIENNSSGYSAPPLEIASGTVKNLTIRAVGTPSADTSKAGAYAVHVEDNCLYNNTLTFENCVLYSDFNSAVGIGMRGGCEVSFTGVQMTGLENGLFCHDSAYVKYSGVQNLSMIDCVAEGMEGESAVRFDSQGTEGSEVHLLFVNNILVNENAKNADDLLHTQNNGGKGTKENWQGLKHFYLDENSANNNVEAMNYR